MDFYLKHYFSEENLGFFLLIVLTKTLISLKDYLGIKPQI